MNVVWEEKMASALIYLNIAASKIFFLDIVPKSVVEVVKWYYHLTTSTTAREILRE